MTICTARFALTAALWFLSLLSSVASPRLGPKAGLTQPEDSFFGYRPQEGDVIFQTVPTTPLTVIIEGITQSTVNHSGIVYFDAQQKRWAVYESIFGVISKPLDAWIRRGSGDAFVAFRVRAPWNRSRSKAVASAAWYLGAPYDFRYEFGNRGIYCTELVQIAWRDAAGIALGVNRRLGDLNWRPYSLAIRLLNGGSLPLDREMITPPDMMRDPRLREVARVGYTPTFGIIRPETPPRVPQTRFDKIR
jgi:hypothetical protein